MIMETICKGSFKTTSFVSSIKYSIIPKSNENNAQNQNASKLKLHCKTMSIYIRVNMSFQDNLKHKPALL